MKVTNIEVLPVACVGLLLVVMMIMVAPMVISYTKTEVEVPKAQTSERKVENELVITITKHNQVFLNDLLTDTADLRTALTELLLEDPFRLVVIRADRQVRYKNVIDIIALAKEAGAKRIACATKKEKNEL